MGKEVRYLVVKNRIMNRRHLAKQNEISINPDNRDLLEILNISTYGYSYKIVRLKLTEKCHFFQ